MNNIEKMFSSEDVFNHFIKMLGYENNIHPYKNGLYDFTYNITINNESHIIISIKKFDEINEDEIKSIHKIYWNKNDIPISILIFPNEVRVYNNFNYDDSKALLYSSKKNKNLISIDSLKSENIISGVFWNEIQKHIKSIDRVDKKLLTNLQATVKKICDTNANISRKMAFGFITKCIFVKYLEDRQMIGKSVFQKYSAESFSLLLYNKNQDSIKEFFKYLQERFNGDVFNNLENDIIESDVSLDCICDFFNATQIESGQLSMFPYDFSIIPIELISSIYEKFFDVATDEHNKEISKKDTGSFYTPYYLSEFILNRSNIIKNLKTNSSCSCRILDPACGSGVFLVGAFKKIVNEIKSTSVKITSKKLEKIITTQIFGIDSNPEALNITMFSLYIALLDFLEPKDIELNGFQFPKLIGKSLFNCSFFNEKSDFNKIKYDLIIGNPPWASIKGDHIDYCKKNKLPISDNQIAQSFMLRSKDIVTERGTISFIVTNSIFYNTNAKDFRLELLKNFKIEEILNFSSISNKLFADASFPCSIVKYSVRNDKQYNKINFTVFKPNIFCSIFNKIVFDFNQTISINEAKFLEDDYLWNILLYGTQLDYYLIKKMLDNTKLGTLCDKNKLTISQGYSAGKRDKKTFDYNGYPILSSSIDPFNINIFNLKDRVDNGLKYERIHDKEMYKKNHKLIIRRTLTNKFNTNICSYFNGELIFNNKYFCIFCDDIYYDENLFAYLEAILNSKIYMYFQVHMSSALKLNPPEIRKDRLVDFPIIDFDKNNTIIKKIVHDVIEIRKLYCVINNSALLSCTDDSKGKIELLRKNIDNNIYELYNLNESETETVNYTIDFVVPLARNKKSVLEASIDDVKRYCSLFEMNFNDILFDKNLKLVSKVESSKFFYKVIFLIVEKDSDVNNKYTLNAFNDIMILISSENDCAGLLVNKKIKGFYKNSFYIVKPKDRYNWQVFNALLDINDFISDVFSDEVEEMGYE